MEDIGKVSEICGEEYLPYNKMSVWHWLVVIGTVLGTVLEGIIPHSFGTLIAHFRTLNNTKEQSSLNATQFSLNWLPALSSAIPCILLPLLSIKIYKYNKFYQWSSAAGFGIIAISCGLSSLVNSWQMLLITYSLIYSIGCSLVLSVIILISAEYFPTQHKFHVLSTSIYQAGYPIAALIGNPMLAVFISTIGWQKSLRVVILFDIVLGAIISCFFKPLKNKGFCNYNQDFFLKYPIQETPQRSINLKDLVSIKTVKDLVKIYQMWPWLIGKYLNYMCWYAFRTNVVTYLVKMTDFGLSKSASLMAIYAAAEIVVAFLSSMFGDYLRGWLVHIHMLATVCLALLMCLYTIVLTSYTSAIILMACIGMLIQLSLSFGYPASFEVGNGELDMKISWILTNVVAGLGIISSPLISGILMDNLKLQYLFYVQSFLWILQALLFASTIILMKCRQWHYDSESETSRLTQ